MEQTAFDQTSTLGQDSSTKAVRVVTPEGVYEISGVGAWTVQEHGVLDIEGEEGHYLASYAPSQWASIQVRD